MKTLEVVYDSLDYSFLLTFHVTFRLKKTRREWLSDQWAEQRREKEEAAARYRKRQEERMKQKEELEKKKKGKENEKNQEDGKQPSAETR